MISASMSAIVLTVAFGALLIRHLGSFVRVAAIVRDDVGQARARRQAALQAWDQRTTY